MGREVRRVPAGWQHPTDDDGNPIPLHYRFPYNSDEIVEGLADGWLSGGAPHYNIGVMPDWPDADRTHFQMYETCTEGTPISPVMASAEDLARWLADSGASAFASRTASYEQWMAMISRGSAVSMITDGKRILSGVEASL